MDKGRGFKIRALGEIAIRCNDLQKMTEFYHDVLGLEYLTNGAFEGITFFKISEGFGGHTSVLALFEKHGIENVGYWVPDNAPNTLIYIIKHKTRDAAKKSWNDVINDPDWKAAAEKSNKDGAILAKAPESVFMTETNYSMLKK